MTPSRLIIGYYFSMLYLENYFRNYKNFLKVILYFSKKNTTCLKLISEISLNLNEHKTIEKVINIIYQLHEIKNDKEIFGYCGIMKHKINNYFNAIISYPDIYYSQLKTFLFLASDNTCDKLKLLVEQHLQMRLIPSDFCMLYSSNPFIFEQQTLHLAHSE